MSGPFYYVTQERAFAPGIADGWPLVIGAPHTKHGRLVRRNGDPDTWLAALKEAENALADYVQQLEAAGGSMNYGHAVLRQIRAAIAQAA